MAWFLGQSLVFLVLAFLLGVLVGWLIWGQRSGSSRSARSRPSGSLASLFSRDERGRGAAAPQAAVETVHQAVRRPVREPAPNAPVAAAPAPEARVATAPAVAPAEHENPREQPESVDGDSVDADLDAEPVPVEVQADPIEGLIVDVEDPEPAELEAEPEPEPEAEPGPVAGPEPGFEAEPQAIDLTEDAPAEALAELPIVDAEIVDDGSDDLQRIEGIGPKISSVLRDAGVHTYRDLAALDRLRLTEILSAGGVKFAPSLSTWGEQARLLASGDERGFTDLTSRLVADRRAR